MATTLMLAFIALFLAAGPANAQFGLGSLFGTPSPPPPPGAGRSVADVVCATQDLSTFCQLIRASARNPTVAELLDPTFTGTVFAPTNKAFEDTQRRLTANLGVASVADLQKQPAVAARLIGHTVVTGQAVQYEQLKNGQKYRSSSGDILTIDSGLLGGLYVKGPTNTVKIQSGAGQNDIPAARAYIHKVDGVIVPKKQ